MVFEFCHGHSFVVTEVILKYQGTPEETIQFGRRLLFTAFFIGECAMVTELIIYVDLFKFQNRHNQQLSKDKIVTPEQIQKRYRKNVITLSGQGLTFLVRIGLTMLAHFLLTVTSNDFIRPASFPIWRIIIGSVHEIAYFWSSPELRRFYL